MAPSPSRPDYGIDAPGVRRLFVAVCGVGLIACVTFALVPVPGSSWLTTLIGSLGAVAALYGAGMALYMTYGSRVGKVRARERLLRAIPWTGSERVLDVGCGRGLMLIGAALRVPRGMAIGIDLWSSVDQSDNSPAAAYENARRAGVIKRVHIDTGDMRRLPYQDQAFDMVLSHWALHNIPDAEGRHGALQEMLRVLRPGGWLVLADISHQRATCQSLRQFGVRDLREDHGGIETALIGFFSGGSFRPQAIIARAPTVRWLGVG